MTKDVLRFVFVEKLVLVKALPLPRPEIAISVYLAVLEEELLVSPHARH